MINDKPRKSTVLNASDDVARVASRYLNLPQGKVPRGRGNNDIERKYKQSKTLRYSGRLTTIMLLVCAVALPLSAKDKKQVTRPFKNVGLMSVLVTPISATRALVHNEEDGNSTHIELYHNTGDGIMDRGTGQFLAGSGTVTAANGDKANWVLDPKTGRYLFTGGTGRFEYVSGFMTMTSATVLSQSQPLPPYYIFTMTILYTGEGEITY